MEKLAGHMPKTAIISVGHRPELEAFHERKVNLVRRKGGAKLISHGDSTQSFECPQGDGWASLTIMKVTGAKKSEQEIEKWKIKCSTASGTDRKSVV